MEQITNLIPIVIVTAIIELAKQLGLKDKYVKPAVVLVGGLMGILATFFPSATTTAMPIIIYVLAASGLYSLGVKPVQDIIEAKKE
jgi:hypothetical protein